AVGGAGEGFEGGEETLDLGRLHFAGERMAEAHRELGALEVGEFGGVILHGLKEPRDRVLRGGDLGPIAAGGGGEDVLVLENGERHGAGGDAGTVLAVLEGAGEERVPALDNLEMF